MQWVHRKKQKFGCCLQKIACTFHPMFMSPFVKSMLRLEPGFINCIKIGKHFKPYSQTSDL